MDAGLWIEWIIKSAVLLVILLTGFAYLTLFERRVLAKMQVRIGPNRVGPWGLLQPFADVLKLLCKEIIIPKNKAGKDLILSLGALNDFDNAYFNGVEVGRTDITTANWSQTPRNYVVPGRLVKAGRNVIAVRLFDRFNDGGFVGNAGLPMLLSPKPKGAGSLGYYHPDYRNDFPMGDNPYRYYRW